MPRRRSLLTIIRDRVELVEHVRWGADRTGELIRLRADTFERRSRVRSCSISVLMDQVPLSLPPADRASPRREKNGATVLQGSGDLTIPNRSIVKVRMLSQPRGAVRSSTT